jgi:protein TonB
MTIFLAAVLHGMVILGLTFASGAKDGGSAPGLEVLLVSDEVPTAERNDSATYLAQRTQLGSGNTTKSVPPRNAAAVQPAVGQDGQADGTQVRTAGKTSGGQDERVLAATAIQPDIRYFTDQGPDATPADAPAQVPERTAEQLQDDVGPAQLRGPHRDELWVTPDARESMLAPYLDGWRHRVERVGTLNYPTAARRAESASPVLEVAIGADGKLEKAVIRRSSGYPDLDQAALEILKLASPFDPFPPELASHYRTLRFAYEWQFVGGRMQGGAVSTVP